MLNTEKNEILKTIYVKGSLNRMEHLKKCNEAGTSGEVSNFFDECIDAELLRYKDQELRMTIKGRLFIADGGFKQ